MRIRGLLLASVAVALYVLERRRPLRTRVEPARVRHARNATVAVLGAVAVHFVERPIVEPLARCVERHRWGLLPAMRLPRQAERILALLLLDYTLYVWHVLVHRVPWLWRFHVVHHVDRDLDMSTAVRFHFGELSLSTPWRAAQVVLIGVRPDVLHLWQYLVLASILFHHSNLRLPRSVERLLSLAIVTPKMHGIHHSTRPVDMNANWSSGLALWDMLHGTIRTDVLQSTVTIGVDGYENPSDVTLPRLIVMPFARAHAQVRAAGE